MVLTIGATGHRFLSAEDLLRSGVNQALDVIERRFGDHPLTVMSSLAEGADRLIASEILRRPGATLVVPLPLPRADYARDFADPASVQAFNDLLARADRVLEMQPAASRTDAYMAAGHFIVDHCDVLIAMWDGEAEQGAGGTALVVARARERQLPLAWVHTGNRQHGTNTTQSLGAEQGVVTFENF